MTDRNTNKSGYKKTRLGWIPEEWKVRSLNSIADISMGQSPKSEFYNENDLGLPLIQGNSDIQARKTKPRYWTSQITKACDPGDIILSVRAPVGSVAKSEHNACIGRGVCAIKYQKSPEFLYQLLIHMEPVWNRFAQGSTFEAVVSKDVKRFKIPFPPIDEQKEIAEILSTWDQAIEQMRALIDGKRRLKKGLMQQILTGRLRFPEFGRSVEKKSELPKGWSRKKLKDITKIIVSNVDKKTKNSEISVLLCNYMDVFSNYYISSSLNFMQATANKREIEKYTLRKYDVLITKDSETSEDIASTSVVLDDVNNLICGYHLAILRPKSNLVNGLYLSYMLDFGKTHHYFVSHANGVTRFGLTISTIENAKIPSPLLEEQGEISSILFGIDREIEYLNSTIKLFKKQKKGLMQRLLAGVIRVC